jgi:hypothetical protein
VLQAGLKLGSTTEHCARSIRALPPPKKLKEFITKPNLNAGARVQVGEGEGGGGGGGGGGMLLPKQIR